jgi:hypothetical protein
MFAQEVASAAWTLRLSRCVLAGWVLVCAGTFGSIKNNHVSHVDMLADTNVTASLDCAGDKTYYRNCFSECGAEAPGWGGCLACSVPLTSVPPAALPALPCSPPAVPAQTAIILMVVGGLAFSVGIFLVLLCCGCCKCCNEKGGELWDAGVCPMQPWCASPSPTAQAPVSTDGCRLSRRPRP